MSIEQQSFQAEVQQVLDIVIHSLYTDKDIFLRELVSNASDALEKMRHQMLVQEPYYDDKLPLEINISQDDQAGTITIQDFGIGMTREELKENLGRIAHSGSRAFLEALKQSGKSNDNLIGKFGVGFYSVFMVAKRVRVYSRSWKPEAESLLWTCEGGTGYTIETSEGQRRGLKIVIELKDEYKDFAKESRIRSILERHSRFVGFPVHLNGTVINKIQPLWLKSKSEVKEEDYKEFYQFACHGIGDPLYTLHFSADAPIAIHSLLYVPSSNPEKLGLSRMPAHVALHCRKVLIDPEPEGLLPEWLRFLQGVVDSEDLPLNISRESMQDSALFRKIGNVLTNRFLKHLEKEAKDSPETYQKFYQEFGNMLKEGLATDFQNRDKISPLLRFESSTLDKGTLTSLDDYISRMPEEQKEIYFLCGRNRDALEKGPWLEAFRSKGWEVLLLTDPIDDYLVGHLHEFKDKKLVSADAASVEIEAVNEPGKETLSESDLKSLCEWIQSTLGEEVKEVKSSRRLNQSPAIVLNRDEGMTSGMRRILKAMQPELAQAQDLTFEINPVHPLVHKLNTARQTNPTRAELALRQLWDTCLLSAGLLEKQDHYTERTLKLLEEFL
jgi:TNF receptor-associated protein 1